MKICAVLTRSKNLAGGLIHIYSALFSPSHFDLSALQIKSVTDDLVAYYVERRRELDVGLKKKYGLGLHGEQALW